MSQKHSESQFLPVGKHSATFSGFSGKFGLGRSKATEDLPGVRLSNSTFYSISSTFSNDEISSIKSDESTSTLTEENQPPQSPSPTPSEETTTKPKVVLLAVVGIVPDTIALVQLLGDSIPGQPRIFAKE